MTPRLLVCDDDADIVRLLEMHLSAKGHDVRTESCAEGLRQAMREEEFHAVLLDLFLPDGNGVELIGELREIEPDLPVILITAHGSIEQAVEAMKAGAYDFSPKPIDLPRITAAVKNAVEHALLRRRLSVYERTRRTRLCNMIGSSPDMQVVYRIIETVARTNASVLITGESGVGKELAAQAVHALSPRNSAEMIDVNCAAIPKELMESELFGHEKSSFTGAGERSIGKCEKANGSTLFLDEITEMDPSLQAKLLRFLQDHSFYRVGGKERIGVDVRIISATNRDPLKAIADGVLREDLYYRLNVVQLLVPALRERVQDIPELAESFLARFASEHNKRFETINDEALAILCAHQWPGNIRELYNSIQQAIVLNDGDELTAQMLPETVRKAVENAAKAEVQSQTKQGDDEIAPFEIVERGAIENALRVMKGNVAKASAALHLSQATFYRKIRDYDLDMKSFKKKG